MNWNTLTQDQHDRLCECRSKKSDIIPIAKAYMSEKGYDADTALTVTLEHLDANNQFFDLTSEDWSRMIKRLEREGSRHE